MPSFSANSRKHLATCHEDLQRVLNLAITRIDFAVICGHRNAADQERAWRAKVSNVRWPHSRHNKTPSEAVDVCPVPVDWTDYDRFETLAKVIRSCADELGVELVWGGDWKMRDLPHFELAP